MKHNKPLIAASASSRPEISARFFTSNKVRVVASASFSILVIIIVYVWIISSSSWISSSTGVYAQLAAAFQHGSLSMDAKPRPELLALPNPYNPNERHNIRYPKDFSLYNGKFYLYFGPVPALFLLVVKLLSPDEIGDNYLVIVFVLGTLIFQSLLIIKIWKRFFKNIPTWMMSLCILLCGLVSPIPWILSQSRVYEAASTGGQFFFVMGLYFVFSALDREPASVGQFMIAGISWALAIGSRVTQIVPIGFVIFMIIVWAFRAYFQTKLRSKAILPLIALGLPLVFGMAILGWYNWARFDSVFETGYSYQLAGPYLQKYSHVLFSPLYLLPNLYNYLLMQPKINTTFPFLQPVAGNGADQLSTMNLPPIYSSGELTGLLFTAPFVLFAGIPLLSLLSRKKDLNDQVDQENDTFLFKWLIISLLGSFLFGFAPVITFFFVETRYIADFMPSLVFLSIIGFWQGDSFLISKPAIHKLYVAVGMVLIVTSIVVSVLVALSVHTA
jgi:hypothetical protein